MKGSARNGKRLGDIVLRFRHALRMYIRTASGANTSMMAMVTPSDTAKRIVEMHRGDISVESEPGSGSTCKVWIPYTQSGK